jgi:3-isopropylmalate dehydrogenase
MSKHQILLLPGDGIGPEVMAQVKKIILWLENNSSATFELTEDLIGGAAIDEYGTSLTEETLEKCKNADAVLLGAVGGPKWEKTAYEIRPEAGLLKLRKELDLFANLRPAIVFDALADASSLKKELVRGLDILIVRELTGGIYFGEPRLREKINEEEEKAIDTQVYSTSEITRIAHVAFELAEKRDGRVCSVDKANVMESGRLWRETVTKLHQEEYPKAELSHMYVDNCAMQLVREPSQFDVIVTDNLFGDILSDCASMLTGSLGMLPSACLGPEIDGKRNAMYEPVHGSAPDIAGEGSANPIATILSLAMALRFSLNKPALANKIEKAVKQALNDGYRTADIMSDGAKLRSTAEIGDAICGYLEKSKAKAA